MRLNIRTFILIISAVIGVTAFQAAASDECYSYIYQWVAGFGDWSIPENWEHFVWDPSKEECVPKPGVPGADDFAVIDGGTAIITGNAQVGGIIVGAAGSGKLIQTGGNVTSAGLTLNYAGTYELQQGSLNAKGVEVYGNFIQSGGNVTLSEGLSNSGTYELQQGSLNAKDVLIVGNFIQTGGNVTLGGQLLLGGGTYELHQGGFDANVARIYGEGTFVQTGGNVTLSGSPYEDLCLSNQGTYELLGGTLNASSIVVGQAGYTDEASFVVNNGIINGTHEYAAIWVFGSKASLIGPGTFDINVVYESDEIYGTYGVMGVAIGFLPNCLTEGGEFGVTQITPADFADGNVANLLPSSVFDVNFAGEFCGEFTIAIPYNQAEVDALGVDEANLVILHETGPETYERLDDIMVYDVYDIVSAKA
ncbi:MAG: hypothetical protein MUP16_07645, partial [Sedimentisphaerales bacterium]|nr:hypothetical protein [Sedimentisphaerales bacterium]